MAKAIATIEGTALVPGISKNGRHYSKEAIAKAVARLSERINSGADPAVMLTSHGADDDSRRIVGRLTAVSLAEDGSARFSAQIANTDEGRKIAALVDTRDGPAFLKGVSIRGSWIGNVSRKVAPDGRTYEEAPDLEIDGLDFTRKPGVPGAQIDHFTPAESGTAAESASNERVPITESVEEALVTAITENDGASLVPDEPVSEADTPPLSKRDSGLSGNGAKWADPGYQKDKKQRYDISTKAKAKAAWSYVNQADNARAYTSAQLKRVKARIVKALKAFGVTVATQERWLIEPARQVTETLAECWDMDRPEAALYLSLTNGPTTVTVSSTLLDAHDLDLVGRAAMAGACDALMALDPDMDADIDLPGAEAEDTDDGLDDEDDEPGSACACGCGCAVPHPMAVADGCPCACGCDVCKATGSAAESAPQTPAEPAAETTTSEEAPVSESTTPAETTPGTPESGIDALSAKVDRLTDALANFVTAMAPKPVEAAPAAPAPVAEQAPAAPAVAESEDERIARLVAEGIAKALPTAVQEHVESSGGPARKGLATPVTESGPARTGAMPEGWPDKPLHQYTTEEWRQYVAPNTVGAILGARGALPEDI
jgi:hypothetical protein